jgi:hypothetical protein
MAHTVLINLTGNDSGDEIQEVADGIGKSIIRAATKPNADYGSDAFPDPWSQRLQGTPLAPQRFLCKLIQTTQLILNTLFETSVVL